MRRACNWRLPRSLPSCTNDRVPRRCTSNGRTRSWTRYGTRPRLAAANIPAISASPGRAVHLVRTRRGMVVPAAGRRCVCIVLVKIVCAMSTGSEHICDMATIVLFELFVSFKVTPHNRKLPPKWLLQTAPRVLRTARRASDAHPSSDMPPSGRCSSDLSATTVCVHMCMCAYVCIRRHIAVLMSVLRSQPTFPVPSTTVAVGLGSGYRVELGSGSGVDTDSVFHHRPNPFGRARVEP